MDKPTLADVEAGGRWINDDIAQVYAQWEKVRDDIIARYAADVDLPDQIEATALAARKRELNDRERWERQQVMQQELRPIYERMAQLKCQYWLPIVTL